METPTTYTVTVETLQTKVTDLKDVFSAIEQSERKEDIQEVLIEFEQLIRETHRNGGVISFTNFRILSNHFSPKDAAKLPISNRNMSIEKNGYETHDVLRLVNFRPELSGKYGISKSVDSIMARPVVLFIAPRVLLTNNSGNYDPYLIKQFRNYLDHKLQEKGIQIVNNNGQKIYTTMVNHYFQKIADEINSNYSES